jgi:hypothetical protein
MIGNTLTFSEPDPDGSQSEKEAMGILFGHEDTKLSQATFW